MPVNARGLRARAERIHSPASKPHQPPPSEFRNGGGMFPVVIRSTQAELLAGATIRVQRVRYASSPPVDGEVEAVGPVLDAYSFWGMKRHLYANFAWGTADPSGFNTVIFMAAFDRGNLVLVMPLKAAGSVIDPNTPASGCNRG